MFCIGFVSVLADAIVADASILMMKCGGIAVVLLAATAYSSFGQEQRPAQTISVGLAWSRSSGTDHGFDYTRDLSSGWYLSVSKRISTHWDFTVEGNHGTGTRIIRVPGIAFDFANETESTALLAGTTCQFSIRSWASLFIRMLGGVAELYNPTVQVGGGVNLWFNEHIGVEVNTYHRSIFVVDEGSEQGVLVQVGWVVRYGR